MMFITICGFEEQSCCTAVGAIRRDGRFMIGWWFDNARLYVFMISLVVLKPLREWRNHEVCGMVGLVEWVVDVGR